MQRITRKTSLLLAAGIAAANPLVLKAQITVAPTFQGAITDIPTNGIASGTLDSGGVG